MSSISAEWVRSVCMALPHTTEKIQWGDNLVFKVGEKIYVVVPLEPAKVALSFKCTKECLWPCGPPNVMKMGFSRASLVRSRGTVEVGTALELLRPSTSVTRNARLYQ